MSDAQHPSEDAPSHEPTHTPVSLRSYFIVYGALLILMFLTVGVALFDWGAFGVVVALLIAITKAVLVLVYFMHLRYSSYLTWLFAGAGFAWLLIMFAFTMADYLSRGWVEQ